MNISRFTLRGFKRPPDSAIPTLGKLECRVMEEAWRGREVSVRDIQKALSEQQAYTTVMTTLDRLYKKGLLCRRKDGRAFLYSPRVSREELKQGILRDVIEALVGPMSSSAAPVLATFVDTVSAGDRELLDELERLVHDKKKEIRSKE